MKFKIAFFSLLFAHICAPTNAQEWAQKAVDDSPRHLEWATIKAGDRKVQAFVAYPEVSEKATAIVLIHEIYGHSDWVRLMADHLAEAGYLVVAPDLLSGMAPDGDGTDGFENVTDVRKAVSELPPEQVTSDLKATVAYAKSLPASNGKVVVAGFCWGGSQSFRFATNSNQIEAAFVYYGTAPEDKEALKRISVPVYGFYAENDARVNATLLETAEAMKELGKDFRMEIFTDAGHGFMRAGEAPDANEGNEKARALGWQRTLELLNK